RDGQEGEGDGRRPNGDEAVGDSSESERGATDGAPELQTEEGGSGGSHGNGGDNGIGTGDQAGDGGEDSGDESRPSHPRGPLLIQSSERLPREGIIQRYDTRAPLSPDTLSAE